MKKLLAAAVGAVALLAAGVAVVRGTTPSGVPAGPGGQPAPEGSWSCPEPCGAWAIAFAGDTFIGNAANKRIRKHGYGYVLAHADALLGDADFTIVNAEAPLTRLKEPSRPGQKWSYNSSPKVAAALAGAGVDALGFANNHTFDRGPDGITDTVAHANSAGIAVFGAGANRDEAEAPLLLETPHGDVAVVAIQARGAAGEEAGPDAPGTPRLRASTITRLHRRAVDAGAEHVVAFVHWGRNYAPLTYAQKRDAALLAEAGFDLVVGHGPHVIQPVGRLDGVPVLYSVGNFVFNTAGRYERFGVAGYGMVATAFLGPDGFEAIELRCLQADNQRTKYKPRPCDEAERADAFRSMGPEVRVRGDVGVVAW